MCIRDSDYIKRDQIDWYCKKSAEFTRNNGGEPVPSLAFFHIALPEFNQAASDENAQLYGIRREKACAPALNSGLFTAIKENGDVMGIFVGHDHDDDYAVCWYDVLLAYGRFTGGPTEYIHIPVSYTHLDVYKRQPVRRATAFRKRTPAYVLCRSCELPLSDK